MSTQYMRNIYSRAQPEFLTDAPALSTEDEASPTGEELARGGYGVVFSKGADAVEKQYRTREHAEDEADKYKTLYNILDCPRDECCNTFLFAAKKDKSIIMAPQGYTILDYIVKNKRFELSSKFTDCLDRESPLCSLFNILRDVVSAVACLHTRGYAHGDIKHANMIVTCSRKYTPRTSGILIDIGSLSKMDESDMVKVTEPGTPFYMTQQRKSFLKGERPDYDARADDVRALLMSVTEVFDIFAAAMDLSDRTVLRIRDIAKMSAKTENADELKGYFSEVQVMLNDALANCKQTALEHNPKVLHSPRDRGRYAELPVTRADYDARFEPPEAPAPPEAPLMAAAAAPFSPEEALKPYSEMFRSLVGRPDKDDCRERFGDASYVCASGYALGGRCVSSKRHAQKACKDALVPDSENSVIDSGVVGKIRSHYGNDRDRVNDAIPRIIQPLLARQV